MKKVGVTTPQSGGLRSRTPAFAIVRTHYNPIFALCITNYLP